MLALVPARPETDDEPAAGDVIEDRGLLREDGRMAERVRQDTMADRQARDAMGQRGRDRDGLPARAATLDARIGQVVVHPGGIECDELARASPDRVERRPVDALG